MIYKKISVIEVIRGIAALLVVFLHAREIAWIGMRAAWSEFGISFSPSVILGYLTFPVVWGAIGVPIFFVLSGYCIHLNHAIKLNENPNYKINEKKYLYRRFLRIYPVLIAALILTFIFDSISQHYVPNFYKFQSLSLDTFLGNLFAVQGLLTTTFGSNGPLWSLSIEIQLYIFYLLLFSFRKKFGILKTFILVAIINITSAFIFVEEQFFTSYLLCWCLGAYIAEPKIYFSLSNKLKISIFFLLLPISLFVFFLKFQLLTFNLDALAFAFLFSAILLVNQRNNFAYSALKKVGDMSYSLYIIHLPTIVLLDTYILSGAKSPFIFFSLFCILASIFVAYLFYLVVERPFINLLSNSSQQKSSS